MLRIRTLGASAVALIASAGFAAAADLGSYEPPPAPIYTPASAFTWTGPYIGLQGGYGWGNHAASGWLGGAYMGYNFQTGTNWVLGIEGDVNASGKKGTSGTTTVKNSWDASVRGRVGYAFDRFMVYGTGGVVFGNVSVEDSTAPATSHSATKVGWTAGAGLEASLTDNVIGRLEFRHKNFGTTSFSTGPNVSYRSNDVLVGIGVKF